MSDTIIKFSAKLVRNLGNFESVHVDAGVEDAVREGETAQQAFDRVKAFVERNLVESVNEYVRDLKSK